MKRVILVILALAAMARAEETLTPLGQAFEVNTPWKAKAGDDPRWAEPEFDDSSWAAAKALPPQNGFVWYRMAVRLPEEPGPYGLWIPRVLKAAEFFVNGQKLGEHGSVDKWYLERRGLVEPLPLPAALRGGEVIHIAVRVKQAVAGPGIPLKPVIGSWKGVSSAYQLGLIEVYRQSIVSLLLSLLSFGTILVALIYWGGKADRLEALWVGGILLSYFFFDFDAFRALGARQGWTLLSSVAFPASIWAAWRFFRGTASIPWRAQAPYLAIIGAQGSSLILARFELVPYSDALLLTLLILALSLIQNGVDAWRRGRGGEPWILWFFGGYLLASLGALFLYAGSVLRILQGAQVGSLPIGSVISHPVSIDFRQVGEFVSGAIMVGILAHRFYVLLQEKQALAAELEAARQVQELLLPAAGAATPGFAVESAYLPARQVGGDFYFVNPLPDGRLLVVVGDVSGKGLRAAMLVSVVVGILRTAPAASASGVLAALNSGLVGRTGGGFVTACSLIFEADGSATISNAGHCPVYRDGVEVPVEPNLPLGVVAEAAFEEAHAGHGCFVLISDGVVEAENAQRELFGFDRTREISGKSAQEIAEAAKAWGQNDDITVVTVRRKI